MHLTMPKFLIERSDKDANLFLLHRQHPDGQWSGKVGLRAPHDLKRILLEHLQALDPDPERSSSSAWEAILISHA
jgi:hypothetical protein